MEQVRLGSAQQIKTEIRRKLSQVWASIRNDEFIAQDGQNALGLSSVSHSSMLTAGRTRPSHPYDSSSSRPLLHSIHLFDRPPLRHGPSMLVTPQIDSNMVLPSTPSLDSPPLRRDPSNLETPHVGSNAGYGSTAPIHLEMPHESPLSYASLDRPWNAMNAQHWDFSTDGVISA